MKVSILYPCSGFCNVIIIPNIDAYLYGEKNMTENVGNVMHLQEHGLL